MRIERPSFIPGQVIEGLQAYEVQFSTIRPADKWRNNRRCLVLCNDAESAIAAVRSHYLADNLVVHQVIHRNRDSDVVIPNATIWPPQSRQ
jgi:hypothetical protein